jgi:hypothetical protein
MFNRWAASVLVLALCALTPDHAIGQAKGPAGRLGSPYPNPFNPHVTVPFTIACEGDAAKQFEVSVQILNSLVQPVVHPRLHVIAGTSGSAAGRPTNKLKITCGSYEAFWDGKDPRTGKEAASGIYVIKFTIDGRVELKKITLRK